MTTPRLIHGEAIATLRTLPPGSVDAVITDPPYSSGGLMRSDRQNSSAVKYRGWSQNADGSSKAPASTAVEFSGDNRDQRTHLMWSTMWLEEALRVTASGGHLLAFTDWRQLPLMSDAIQLAGWVWRGMVVWDKGIARPVKGRFRNHVEYVLWASNGAVDPELNPVYLPSVYRFTPPAAGKRVHVTEKPIDLMAELLKITPPGVTILDPFMGSGSTGVAAIQSGRGFVGIEMTDHYYEVAANRIRTSERPYQGDELQDALDLGEPA